MPDQPPEQFDVFLCHNSQDKAAVKKIGEKLKEQGLRPWLDEWELQPGLPWQRLLEEQIESIRSAAVFVGEDGVGPWQQVELESFLREFVFRGAPVIPVLLQNAPKGPKLPRFLSNMTWVDFRTTDPDPMKRLVWGITGERIAEATEHIEDAVLVKQQFVLWMKQTIVAGLRFKAEESGRRLDAGDAKAVVAEAESIAIRLWQEALAEEPVSADEFTSCVELKVLGWLRGYLWPK